MRLLCVTLTVLAVASPALTEPLARLAPRDITGLPAEGAVAGTSRVSGVTTTVLSGDPGRAGIYTIRLYVPAHTTIRAHSHRDDRSAVVVSGIWWFGYGAKADAATLKPLPAGSFYTEPAGQPHFARTGDNPVVVYITGLGPTDTVYVNPADEPSRR